MAFVQPEVNAVSLGDWCQSHLGSRPEDKLFQSGYLASVIAVRLVDGREVVVKVRADESRIAACTEVQRRLFEAGYPCPEPLAGPAPLGWYAATAESRITGGAERPDSGRAARPFAEALAELVRLAPRPADVPSLAPAPPWADWNHDQGGLWPRPEDLDADLSHFAGPAWLDAAGEATRRKLREGQDDPVVIGHCDWMTENLCWDGSRLLAAYDWDSLFAESEAVIAGVAAAIYLYPTMPTMGETRDFLDAYAAARGRPFSPGELQRCWAAGLWTRAFDARKQDAAQEEVTILTPDEAEERLRQAGLG